MMLAVLDKYVMTFNHEMVMLDRGLLSYFLLSCTGHSFATIASIHPFVKTFQCL